MKKSDMMEPEDYGKTIGEFVAEDYRTANVFESYGIDFCCGGKVRLLEACRELGIHPNVILLQIEAVKEEPLERSQNYAAWELPFLADYLVNTHNAPLFDVHDSSSTRSFAKVLIFFRSIPTLLQSSYE